MGSIDDKKVSGTDIENRGRLSIIDPVRPVSHPASISKRNDDRVTGVLSRGSKLPNVFEEMSQWLAPPYEDIMQAGQHFCYSVPNELLQGGRDTHRRFPG